MADLTRATVTSASRVMMPTHVAFSILIGFTWVTQADVRTRYPNPT